MTEFGKGESDPLKPRPAGILIRIARQHHGGHRRRSSAIPNCGALILIRCRVCSRKILDPLAGVSSNASHGTRDRAFRPPRRAIPLRLVRDVALYHDYIPFRRQEETLGQGAKWTRQMSSPECIRSLLHALGVLV